MKQSENPKRAAGSTKPQISVVPPIAIIAEARVFELGAVKYGAFNWTDKPIDAKTYYSAAMRHLMTWYTGENDDPESGQSHLAHARACLGILLDAIGTGTLIDDRPNTTPVAGLMR